ncbi:D-arabinono-1,4-lactone oxidase [Streptomyces sp. NPDC015661]|uniref:D-arabinono-1,4-lactone oxidase n=1 Tax=Streptomyces sp. NPDC015661 TaxID=3364961 RepID=UPI0036FA8EB1
MNTRHRWRTWSHAAECSPLQLSRPKTEDGIAEAVARAAREDLVLRAAGTGHSFNALAATDDALLDLTRYRGVVAVDHDTPSVTVRAGTRLGELAAALHREGLALPNIGTLAEQTVAGAISTGNHGTGLAHPPLAAEVLAVRLVDAEGEVRQLTREDPELLDCARVSLGALGVLSTITLRCVPAYNLRAVSGSEPLDAVLERFGQWAGSADHVTLSWQPWGDTAGTLACHRTTEPVTAGGDRRRYRTTAGELWAGALGLAGAGVPAAVPRLTGWFPGGDTDPYTGTGHRVHTFPQPVRFHALEHALPLERVPEAMRALRPALRGRGIHSPYSVLVRVGAGDDAPLSPAYGGPTGYVNLTVPRSARYRVLLRTVEAVMREHGGRPHWGKAHTADAAVLAERYPRWDDFQRVRAQLDPKGRFTSDYIRRVLGPVRAPAPAVAPAAAAEGVR